MGKYDFGENIFLGGLESRAWMCSTDSGGDCLFGHDDSVIGGRSACPGDHSLCFPNTSPVSATQTGSPQGPGCSLSATPGLIAPAPVLLRHRAPLPALNRAPALWHCMGRRRRKKQGSNSTLFSLSGRESYQALKTSPYFSFSGVFVCVSMFVFAWNSYCSLLEPHCEVPCVFFPFPNQDVHIWRL